MSPLAIRRRLKRTRAIVACMVVLAAALAAHHTLLPGDDHHALNDAADLVMCLAVLAGAALAVAALPLERPRLAFSPLRLLPVPRPRPRRQLETYARAGPPLFLLLAVDRR